jgi:regulator of sigma E protease
MNFLSSLAAFALAIGILVVVHEYGHYSVARWCGVKVLKFSIGFGKPLYSWTSPRSGTQWTLASLPLGGYVKMLDERESDAAIAPHDLPHAFNRQSLGKRAAIVAAGPIANFILAIVLFAATYVAGVNEPVAVMGSPTAGSLAARAGVQAGDLVTGVSQSGPGDAAVTLVRSWTDLHWQLLDAALDHRTLVLHAKRAGAVQAVPLDFTQIPAGMDRSADDEVDLVESLGFVPGGISTWVTRVMPASAAALAGMQVHDRIVAIDGKPQADVNAFVRTIQSRAGHPLTLAVERAGVPLQLQLTPVMEKDATTGLPVGRIGVEMGAQLQTVNVRYNPLQALTLGAQKTWDISLFSLKTFGRMLTGRASLKNLSGPVTIADYAGRSARVGLSAFISFLALVSISIGVLNLLPIPVLDGGHLLYYSAEAVTGKPVSERLQGVLQRVGVFCILALSMIALFNDLTRLIHF